MQPLSIEIFISVAYGLYRKFGEIVKLVQLVISQGSFWCQQYVYGRPKFGAPTTFATELVGIHCFGYVRHYSAVSVSGNPWIVVIASLSFWGIPPCSMVCHLGRSFCKRIPWGTLNYHISTGRRALQLLRRCMALSIKKIRGCVMLAYQQQGGKA